MEAIYDIGGKLCLAITLPDDKAVGKSGRVYLDEFCSKHEINLLKSEHVNNLDVIAAVKRAEIDWLFIIGWSQIAKSEVLAAPRLGVLGVHPTLLPLGRGRAAIPWAILKGLEKTGVSLFKMDEGVDTGPIAMQIEIPLTKSVTATELYSKVEAVHVQLIQNAVTQILDQKLVMTPQDNNIATVWPGRKPEDGEIDLCGSVLEAERLVRAVTRPYPGAFFYRDDIKHIVWSAQVFLGIDIEFNNRDFLRFKDGFLILIEFESQTELT